MRIDDPDNLPYFVLSGGQPLRVRFTPLEAEDAHRIAETWSGAIYFSVWEEVASDPATRQTTLKLIAADSSDDRILGLLRMASHVSMRFYSGGLKPLSVLETAPSFQHRRQDRRVTGAGKVLVARLIAESVLRGGEGKLIESLRPQSIPFYLHLGFQRDRRNPRLYVISREDGIDLLRSVLQQEEEQ